MINLSQKIKAFTLAEVLLTLLIIGVVASLVIPSLIQDTQNAELITAAKKAISSADQAIKLASIDNGGGFGFYNVDGITTAYTKFNAMKSKLNVIKECPYGTGALGNCWAPNGVGKGLSNNCVQWTVYAQNLNYSFVTSDGMYWMLYCYGPAAGMDWLAIDINGSKGPNDWGKDVFGFTMNNTALTPYTYHCENSLKHNDGTPVYSVTEFKVPFQ